MFKKIKPAVLLTFSFIAIFLLHNLITFPARGSYDAGSHFHYADTLLEKNRLPIREETVHFHNPPAWYLLGSGSIKLVEKVWGITDWRSSITPWQMTNLFFCFLSLVIWYKISQFIFKKKNYKKSLFFILFLFSLPVFIRVNSMLSVEPVLTLLSGLIIYLLFKYSKQKLTLKHLLIFGIILGVTMAIKITGYAFVAAFGLIIFLTLWLKDNQGLFKSLVAGLLIALSIFAISGWFYIYKAKAYGLFTSGRIYPVREQPKSFFFDIPFVLMMNYPVRPHIGNRFFPVIYVDFWGDYWNYFSQRRYGIEIEHLRLVNRETITEKRRLDLVRQVRVNLFTTIIMALGFLFTTIKRVKYVVKHKLDNQSLQSLTLLLFFWVVFLGYFYFQSRAPSWDGSNIKPSHLVYIWPVPILFATEWLFSIKSKKICYTLLTLLVIPISLNLWFSWF